MAYPKVFDLPVKFSLELVTIVRSDFTNAEWELFNDMIDEVYCISLSVLLIDLQSADARRVIDGSILETPHLFALISNECQELNIHLNVVTRNLILRSGSALEVLRALATETSAEAVHWSRAYDPAAIARDTVVKAGLKKDGMEAKSHKGHLLFEPWTIQT